MRCGRPSTTTWRRDARGSGRTRVNAALVAFALTLACASAADHKAATAGDKGASGSAGGPVSAQQKQKLQGEQRELRARLAQLK